MLRTKSTLKSLFTSMTGIIIAVALLTLIGPVAALAAAGTSGGATIHNWVSVSYTSGSVNATATGSVDVAVITLAAQASITTPAGKTVVPSTFVTYSSAITSNANGYDTYNLGPATPTTPTSGISGSPATTFSFGGANVTSITLWGGITVGTANAGQNVLSFPGGSLTGSGLVNGSKLNIGGTIYTVNSTTAGSPNTNVGGATNEVLATITLTTNLAAQVNPGTQIGEWKKFAIEFTAGTPTAAGTDGQYNTVVTATSVATDLTGATQAVSTTGTTTIVQSPKLNISKTYRVLPGGSPITTGTVTPALYTGGPAKPGQIIEYLITIVNANSNAASVASSVNVQDPVVTPYTAYVTGSTYWANGNTSITQVDNNATSKLLPGNGGYTFTNPIAGGNNAAATAYIVYQVTVN